MLTLNEHVGSAAVLFALTALLGVLFLMFHYAMIRAVNRNPRRQREIGILFNYPGKRAEVLAQYKALYPNGRLRLFERISLWAGAVTFLGFCSAVGLIRWDAILQNLRSAFQ